MIPRRFDQRPVDTKAVKATTLAEPLKLVDRHIVDVYVKFPHTVLDESLDTDAGDFVDISGQGDERMRLSKDGGFIQVNLSLAYFYAITNRTIQVPEKKFTPAALSVEDHE